MDVSRPKNVHIEAVVMALVPLAAVMACIAILAKWGIAAGIGFWFLFVVGILLWGLQQGRRARREIGNEIERSGCKVVKMNYRHLRLGPFSLWNSSRTQHVYRLLVMEPTGRERIVWARWGRQWFWNPNTLELKWEDETAESWTFNRDE